MKDNPKKEEGKSKRKKIVDKFYLDYARCMRCDICVEVCNFSAIVMNNTWEGIELSRFDRNDLVMDKDALLAQHRKGDLGDPFREPMGVAHSGWAPKKHGEGEEAANGHGDAIPIAPAAPAAAAPVETTPAEGEPAMPPETAQAEVPASEAHTETPAPEGEGTAPE
jgi:ferredoxin